jgi:hypothetical protein
MVEHKRFVCSSEGFTKRKVEPSKRRYLKQDVDAMPVFM